MHIPSFKTLFTSREKLVKTVQALCKEVVNGGSGSGSESTPQPGQANGLATLDANGKVPTSQLPFVNCTQAEYDAMNSHDENTYYFIVDSSTVIHGG